MHSPSAEHLLRPLLRLAIPRDRRSPSSRFPEGRPTLRPMAGSTDWFRDSFRAEYDKRDAALGRFTLAIFGKTGVGKSTLINAIFGEEVARTGIGEPVTKGSHLYLDKIGHLGIVDTQGLEVGRDEQGDPVRAGQGDDPDASAAAERADPRRLVLRPRHGPALRGHRGRLHPAAGRAGPAGAPCADPGAALGSRDRMATSTRTPCCWSSRSRPGGCRSPAVEPFMTYAMADEFAGQPAYGLAEVLDATFRVAPEGAHGALVAAQQIDYDRKAEEAQRPITARPCPPRRPRRPPRSRSPTPRCWCRSSWA